MLASNFLFLFSMILQHLSITNYKNITSKRFDFNPKINCFIGNNGVGKSNVLDAIYHLSFGKSYFNPASQQNIQFDKDFFALEGRYKTNLEEEKIVCSLKKGDRKTIKRNGKAYLRIADHIGLIPTVIISPSDQDLIIEGSSTRRKFIDGVIGQTDPLYLKNLLDYNKVLAQRNALLKYFALNRTFDATTLGIYNAQMAQLSQPLFEKRSAFIEQFCPIFEARYQTISNQKEQVRLEYSSHLQENKLEVLLEAQLQKDKLAQHSTVGIHKDDISFLLADRPIKNLGSQGQQKSFLVALKLAQFDFLQKQFGHPPILLLDDAFDKLDQNRVAQIVTLVNTDAFGQIFITDTHEERTKEVLSKVASSFEVFRL